MRRDISLVNNVHFNRLALNAMIECAYGLTGRVAMGSAFGFDLTFSCIAILFNATVFASSIICAKCIANKPNGHYLTGNVKNCLTMRRLL